MPDDLVFPHPTLTSIKGKPSNTSLEVMKQEVKANAMAIFSHRGDGTSGHLRLTMTAAAYLAQTNVAFNVPPNPGDNPIHLPAATGPQITEVNRLYDKALKEFTLYNKVHNALKQQVLKAVEPIYLEELADKQLGFSRISAISMLDFLDTNYGTVTTLDLVQNMELAQQDWNPDEPIQALWSRFTKVQDFAARGNTPLADKTIIGYATQVLHKTGVFNDIISQWSLAVDENTVTLAEFKAHFNKANDLRLRNLTEKGGGFHSANAASAIASAVSNEKLASSVINNMIGFYCWTHGLGKNPKHTSATCTNKQEGHKEDATAWDRKGGNSSFQRFGGTKNPPK